MSVATKLRLQADTPLYLLKVPEQVRVLFSGFEAKSGLGGQQVIHQAVIFAANKRALDEVMPKLATRLAKDALLWIAYPKKTGKIKSDMTRDNGWETVFAAGYEPVTQIAVDDDWSALRFRKSEAIGPKLRDVPMEARQIEGVDFVNRTVTFPKDVLQALKPYKELYVLLQGMSFSHKKEYAEAIVSAKKSETRARRIEKMIEMLEKYKTEKEKKKK
jgi:hypothetical protein